MTPVWKDIISSLWLADIYSFVFNSVHISNSVYSSRASKSLHAPSYIFRNQLKASFHTKTWSGNHAYTLHVYEHCSSKHFLDIPCLWQTLWSAVLMQGVPLNINKAKVRAHRVYRYICTHAVPPLRFCPSWSALLMEDPTGYFHLLLTYSATVVGPMQRD